MSAHPASTEQPRNPSRSLAALAGSALEWGDPIRIPTGDIDDPDRTELVMLWGGNGDLYIGTVAAGRKDWKLVHLVMSGGHNSLMPDVTQKLAETYRAAFEHFTQNAADQATASTEHR